MTKKVILSAAVLIFNTASAFANGGDCGGYVSPFSGAYDNWFTDVDELDRHWVETHENPNLPAHKRRFCAERQSGRTADLLINDPFDNTLSFSNPAGPINAGMCWMHSRLQRRATYLANYRPSLPRPTPAQARTIISRIARGDQVVEVPGFRSLDEFSREYRADFEAEINTMGTICFLNPNDCAARLPDSYDPGPDAIRATLDGLRDNMLHTPGDVYFLRTRVPSHPMSNGAARPFVAHSLLVLSMEPIGTDGQPLTGTIRPGRVGDGYTMQVIDPNYPSRVETVTYRYGDRSISAGFSTVIPYRHYEYEADLPTMRTALSSYCRP